MALLVAAAAAAPAYAVTVAPAGAISLTGSTTLGKSGITIGCTANLVGTITSTGEITITSAKFSGNSLCSAVTGTGLPWTGAVLTTTGLQLHNVAVDVNVPLLGGACGPTPVAGTITENTTAKETLIGLHNQLLSGGCSVSGTLQTTPYLTVH
ncbi:hypothetical protein D7S89_17140 [Trinickia fusca]|uniref:Protein activator of alkane oxidation PraB n=1 Tax=Trinickia fusca TaxID=2419777 RepID=A0A494X6N4_9BURK|nr:hypothetical protein D7S89_17140 [Trinickia fusca]